MSGEIVKALQGRNADREALERLIAVTEHLAKTTTDAMEMFGGRAINGVLDVQTQVFPTSGILGGSYGVPCGSVLLVNASNDAVTVISGQSQQGGTPPSVGIGLVIVPAQSFLPVAIANTTWTAFGTVGDKISWQAFSGLQAFGIVR